MEERGEEEGEGDMRTAGRERADRAHAGGGDTGRGRGGPSSAAAGRHPRGPGPRGGGGNGGGGAPSLGGERGCAGKTKTKDFMGNNGGRAHWRRRPHRSREEKRRLGTNRQSD
jgi:hypothetical protein